MNRFLPELVSFYVVESRSHHETDPKNSRVHLQIAPLYKHVTECIRAGLPLSNNPNETCISRNWAARTFWHLTLHRSGQSGRRQRLEWLEKPIARFADCTAFETSPRKLWRGPKWIGRLKWAEKLYLVEARKHPRIQGAHRVLVCLSERRRDRERYGSRAKANQQLSKRSWSRSGRPFSTNVMLWLLMYSVHDVYRQSLADKRRDKKKGPRFEHNVCLPSYLEGTHSNECTYWIRIAKRCRSNLTLVLPSTTRNDGWVSPRSWDRFHERFRNRQILLTFMRPTRPCEILIRGIELWTLENNKIFCVFCGFFGNKVFRRLMWIETINNYFPIPTLTLSFYFSTATI